MRRALLWVVGVLLLGPVLWVLLYRFVNPPITLVMLLKSDREIQHQFVPLKQISPALIDSVIAGEDSGFCTHHGFDTNAIREAWKHNEEGHKLHGASTITQQTAKNIFLWSGRTWVRKGAEAYFTVLMEALWPKQRILELYLNNVEWGDSIYGAEAAAKTYFHTYAARLNSAQSARLAAALPNPEHWSPLSGGSYVVARAYTIQDRANIVQADGLAACVTKR